VFFMIEVEVIVIGSGVSALKTLQIARECGRRVLAVDSTYSDGGYIQVIDTLYRIPKAPIFIDLDDMYFFENLGVEVECFDNEVVVLKEGNYVAKTLGYEDIDVQRNWFSEWVNKKRLCYSENIFEDLKKVLGFEQGKPIHISSGIRKIDVEKKIVALTSGEFIKYKKLVYTWPLPLLPKLLYPTQVTNIVNESIDSLKLNNIPAYILTLLLQKENRKDRVKMYIHSTKASRMHTAIELNIESKKVLYIITSYSKKYPLLPGISEKLLSEIKRFRIASPKNIVKEFGLNIAYTLINRIDKQRIDEVIKKLANYDIHLFGRLGQWREQTIKEILQNKELKQTIC